MAGIWWHIPVIPATQEVGIGRIMVQVQPWASKEQDAIWKITKAECAGDLAQVETLSSNPVPPKQKKEIISSCKTLYRELLYTLTRIPQMLTFYLTG
jgi:hypothetical protein